MQQASVISNIITLWSYLGKKRRLQFFLLFLLMLISMVAEMVSIGAVVPFLAALTEPEMLMKLTWFQPVINTLRIKSPDELLLPLTLGFVIAAVFSSGVRILLLWVNARLSAAMGIQLSSDIYTRTLYQPYEYHVAKNSSQLISMVTQKVGATLNTGISQVMALLNALMLSTAIIVTLLLINSLVAMLAFLILGGGYLLIGYLARKLIKNNGYIIAQNQPQAVKCMQEGLGGIRDIIIDNSQDVFSQSYIKAARNIQLAGMQNGFLGVLPKSLLEMLAITLIVVLAYWLQTNSTDQQSALPVLGALALGAQRLLPSLQQIYFSWSVINGGQTVLAEVVEQLRYSSPNAARASKAVKPLIFDNKIVLEDLSFKYASNGIDVLKDINLNIIKGSTVGFIGTTGSGKSTLLDLVMGLLLPTQGRLLVDGIVIDKNNVSAWQRNIAHVPQNIFLSDASMSENIAFGVLPEKIDHRRVELAAKQAQISEFINELSEGYQTPVGERGVRLSGGQRQRIGIARALYKQADVIIFDEATSALDNETEKDVIQAINNLSDNLTIIIIAHRLSTLEGCDNIIELSHGKVLREGSYSDTVKKSVNIHEVNNSDS